MPPFPSPRPRADASARALCAPRFAAWILSLTAWAILSVGAGCQNPPARSAAGTVGPDDNAPPAPAGREPGRSTYPWVHANESAAARDAESRRALASIPPLAAASDTPSTGAVAARQSGVASVRAPAPRSVSGVIVLDPGHGGHDPGAEGMAPGVGVVREKDVTLAIALSMARDLRARGATVHLTRDDDRFVPLEERSRIANRFPEATFVSIHVNATRTGQNRPGWMVSGVETYVLAPTVTDAYRATRAVDSRHGASAGSGAARASLTARYDAVCRRERGRGERLAALLQREMVESLSEDNRGVKRKDLAVLRETLFCGAALVEVGFLSHAPTAAKLATPAYRDRIALALADGVARHRAGE